MNKRSVLILLAEYETTKDLELGKVALVAFRKLTTKDQLDILVEKGCENCDLKNLSSDSDIGKEDIEKAIEDANKLELIKMKSFLLRTIIFTIAAVIVIFIAFMIYYIQLDSKNGVYEYMEQLFKMVKLILLDKTS